MKVSTQDHAHICVLTLSGEFVVDDADTFHRALGNRIDAGTTRHVILDCEHLEFLDSGALELLLDLQQRLAGASGALRLAQTDETVRTILNLTRLESALECCETIEDAVRSLR